MILLVVIFSLSGDGNTLAVGAQLEGSDSTGVGGAQDNNSANQSGAVYVFTRNGEDWRQQAYIKASNTGAGDRFGNSMSLSANGDILAVGAHLEDSSATGVNGAEGNVNKDFNAGAVYVFTRNGEDWSQQAYIKASNTDGDDLGFGDFFGTHLSLSGDGNTLAVGASQEDSNSKGVGGAQDNNSATNSGAVYVFTRNDEGWSQQAYIKASNTGAEDHFGHYVSLTYDGNTLAVNAYGEGSDDKGVGGAQDDNSTEQSGAVYVFTRSGTGIWSQQAYVKASSNSRFNRFGITVNLSGDGNTLAAGSFGSYRVYLY